ncbi:MAG TPA: hypothetical protein VHT96_12290 [Clostridia bacterium]|nr:hypothetical protein [Clostridia bacterium]
MKNINSTPRTIIITGGNAGLGYECAKNIAKNDKDNFIILACRSLERAETAMCSIIRETANNNIAALELEKKMQLSRSAVYRHFKNKLRLSTSVRYCVQCRLANHKWCPIHERWL